MDNPYSAVKQALCCLLVLLFSFKDFYMHAADVLSQSSLWIAVVFLLIAQPET